MNYKKAIEQCLENFEKSGIIHLNTVYSICSFDHLQTIYRSKENSTEFYKKYIVLNGNNEYHFITIKNNQIEAFPIGFFSIESYIIKYIFPEHLDPEIIVQKKENTINENLIKPLIVIKPKIIQFQIVNIELNTYRYSLLDNGEIIKETYLSSGNFTK